MMADPDGTAIVHDGRSVALKWHQLRRRRSDPLFGIAALKQGLRLGASMEIDLRITADGSFVVLHDATLDQETDGTGEIVRLTREQLTGIHYDDSHLPGGEGKRSLLFTEDVTRLMEAGHPDSMLQLDMKDDYSAVGEAGVERLASVLQSAKLPVLVSGDSSELILALCTRLPGLMRGLEPSFRLLGLDRAGRKKEVPDQLRRELAGPLLPDMVYLNWELVLGALHDGTDLVRICHDGGTKVDAWTFNLAMPEQGFGDREWTDFLRLLELGVDQISTDEAIATTRAYNARIASG